MPNVRFLPFGDAALVAEFGEEIDREVSAAVLALDARVRAARLSGVTETMPSFRSLMIVFDPLQTEAEAVEAAVRPLLTGAAAKASPGRLWRLPVRYGGDAAPDLAEVAAHAGLAPEAVIALHSGQEHHVYMIGFLPGHPYLGDLPAPLRLPRRASPRVAAPAGSVAIAVGLTAIYPVESPGGWNIIGRTPVPLFDAAASPPALLAPGDRVRFEPVAQAEFDRLAAAARAGAWRPQPEADGAEGGA